MRTKIAVLVALIMVVGGVAPVTAGAAGVAPVLPDPVITPGSGSVVEGDGVPAAVLEVPVTLTAAASAPVTVRWNTFDIEAAGLATVGVDYVSDSGIVTFEPGSTSETVAITVIGDDVVEPDEWVLVAFSDPSPNATIDTSFYGLGVGNIVDDDARPVITPGSAVVTEADGVTVDLPVTLSESSPTEVTVSWTTFDWPGLATGDADYVADTGEVRFEPGETLQHVTVTVRDDAVAEPDGEYGLVMFSDPSPNAALDTSFHGLGGFLIHDDGDVGSTGCGGTSGPVTEMRTIETADGPRDYRLHVPASVGSGDPMPLVLHFHGHRDSIARILEMTQVEPLSEPDRFVVVSPVGTELPTGEIVWNNAPSIGGDLPDDTAFIDQLLDQLETDLCVDLDQVFTLGLSGGAAMGSLVGCVLSDRIAAVGAVAHFAHPPSCGEGRPPAVVFHGDADNIVLMGSVQHRVNQWAAAAGCDAVPETSAVSLDYEIELRSYVGCDDDGALEFYVIEGGGHRWPGDGSDLPDWLRACCRPPACAEHEFPCIGETTLELDATAVAWEFFQRP